MGDEPADWLLAFSMNVSSMSLTSAGGGYATVTGNAPIEMIHRLGTMEPVALINAAQGTYTGASFSIASCKFAYLDAKTKTLVEKTITGPFSVSVPFSSSVSLGTTPLAFNFDLDLEKSLTQDNSGAFQFRPQFKFSNEMMKGSNGNGGSVNARYGGMYQMMGIVSAVNGSSFSITQHEAAHTFTFQISNETQFRGRITQMSQLGKDMGVMVTAVLQSDGTFLAKQVRATMSAGGAMGGGIVTTLTPPVDKPTTEFTVVMQNGAGASVLTDYLTKTVTVKLTDTTTYEIDTDRVSLAGLDFTPVLDASNIYVGQSVLPFSDSAVTAISPCTTSCGTITASTVRLREQGFRGTTDVDITPGASSTFTLTLMPECAFTTLTGATQIEVYQLTGTNVENDTAIPAAATLRVHGLLFYDGGKWKLIASTIAAS
ncbi:MAG: hypothetical protein KGM96_11430 [Acidobacteriota bacterium]|nr:hypothetical protein [Acidobacteriota bacterium]